MSRARDELSARLADARARGRRDEEQRARVAHALLARAGGDDDLDGPPPAVLAAVSGASAAPPVAFLATFTCGEGNEVVFPVRPGVTRVGFAPTGDFPRPAPGGSRPIESSQWRVVHEAGRTRVVDARSTNQSVVLPASLPPFGGDPRVAGWTSTPPALLLAPPPGAVHLDHGGAVVYELADGDVLVTVYAAFVFGLWPGDDDVVPPLASPSSTADRLSASPSSTSSPAGRR